MFSERKKGSHTAIQVIISRMTRKFLIAACAWMGLLQPALGEQVLSYFTYVTEVSMRDFKLAVHARSEGICASSGRRMALNFVETLHVINSPDAVFSEKNIIWGVSLDGRWYAFLNAEHQVLFVDQGMATLSEDDFMSLMKILGSEFEVKSC